MKKINFVTFVGVIGVMSVYLLLLSHLLDNFINNKFCYLIIIICGIITFLSNLKELNKSKMLKVLMAYFAVVVFSNVINFQFSYTSIVYSVLWFFVFNIAFSISKKSSRFIIIVSSLFFISFLSIVITKFLYGSIENTEGFYSVTVVYYLICFIPLILLLKHKFIRYLLLIIIVAMSVLSFKRGALLVVGLIMTLFLLHYLFYGKKRKLSWKSCKWFFLFVGITIALFIFIDKKYDMSKLLSVWQYRSDTGAKIGFFGDVRSELYLDVIRMSFGSNIFNLLFGHGYDSVIINSSYNLSAHNDLLEILFDYGLIAFCLYFVFLLFLIKKYKAVNKEDIYSYISFLIILIVTGLVSHMITYPTYVFVLMIYFGLIVKRILYENRYINISQSL